MPRPLAELRKARAPQLPQLKFPSRSSISELFSPLLEELLQLGHCSAHDLVKLFREALVSGVGFDIKECLPDDKAIAATFYTCLASRLGQLLSSVYEVSAPF